MKVQIRRDQAVWEREMFEVEVPDNLLELDADAQREVIETAVENFQGYTEDGYSKEVLDDPVFGISTQTMATLPNDEEIEL